MRLSSNLARSSIIFALLAPFPTSAFADDDCNRWVVTRPNDYTTMIQCDPHPVVAPRPTPSRVAAARPAPHVVHPHVAPHGWIDSLIAIFRPHHGR
jgi:hypothetical protein